MNRCPYCGYPCYGLTCSSCADLRRIERAALEPKPAKRTRPARFLATCPKCGTMSRGRFCPDCKALMYLPISDPMYAAPKREAVKPSKGMEE